ncbi:hypothetical protein PSYPI_47643, partial [Pseudomonas syringae pv. pisi str. 1704B]
KRGYLLPGIWMTGWTDGIVPLPSKQCIGRINKQLNFCNGR